MNGLSPTQEHFINRAIDNDEGVTNPSQKGCFIIMNNRATVNDGKPFPHFSLRELDWILQEGRGYVVNVGGVNMRLTKKAFQLVGRENEYEDPPVLG